MDKQRRRQQTRDEVWMLSFYALFVSLLLTIVFPSQSNIEDYRVIPESEGLRIEVQRTSPPFAALEDEFLQGPEPDMPVIVAATVSAAATSATTDNMRLLAGEQSAVPVAQVLLRERAEAALEATPTLTVVNEPEVTTIRLADLNISKEELLSSLLMPIVTSAPSPQISAPQTPAPPSRRTHKPDSVSVAPPSPVQQQAAVEPEGTTKASMAGVDKAPVGGLLVSGPIELSGGLAVTHPQDQLLVYQEVLGETGQKGQVQTRTGQYRIALDDLRGALVAELRDVRGQVLGRGTFDLDSLAGKGLGQKIENAMIRVTPLVRGLVGHIRNYANGVDSKVRKAIVDATVRVVGLPHQMVTSSDGAFEDPQLIGRSSVVLQSHAPRAVSSWKSVGFGYAAQENDIPIFDDRFILDLQQSLGTTVVFENLGVIVGRVTALGQPSAAATVDLVTTNENLKPIYFDENMRPNPVLTATSQNGYFAFVSVPVGVQAVEVHFKDYRSDPVLVPTQARAVSHVEIDAYKNQKAEVLVFDAFHTQQPLSAQVAPVGQPETALAVDASGRTQLGYNKASGLLFLDTEAGAQYAITRLALRRDQKNIFIPMLSQNWIETIRGYKRVNQEPNTGVVVGFVPADVSYQVFLESHRKANASVRVLYFDAKGKIISGDGGMPGGGFIIFNAPEGLASVSVVPEGSQAVFTALALVEQNVASVIHADLSSP